MIVVDANIIVYHAIRGPMTPLVERLAIIESSWRSSKLWRYEFTSSLHVMLKAKVIDEATANRAIPWADQMMALLEDEVPQPLALANAIQYGISAYDAQYITLAKLHGVTCVTNDAPLARKTPGISVLLADFVRPGTPPTP